MRCSLCNRQIRRIILPVLLNMVYLMLLGVAQDAGVPQTGCNCHNCSAVWSGAMPRQFAVSAALVDPNSSSYWLIDCTPDFKDQDHMLQEWLGAKGLQACKLCGVLLTHLHMGHYLGLMQFGREAMDWKGLQVYGTQSVYDFLRTNQPWKQYLQGRNFTLMPPLVPGEKLQLSGTFSVTPAAVPHRAEFSDAVGFYVQGSNKTAFYLPDIDSWEQWQAAGTDIRQVVQSVDLAFLDACFYDAAELPGRDMSKVPHPMIVDTTQWLEGLAAKTAVVLVHMNHTNPVWQASSEQRRAVLASGLHVGEQGAVYEL